jgi:hypothetical protein
MKDKYEVGDSFDRNGVKGKVTEVLPDSVIVELENGSTVEYYTNTVKIDIEPKKEDGWYYSPDGCNIMYFETREEAEAFAKEHPTRIQLVINCLNDAFKQDPGAIHALMCNRVPCNAILAEHEHVVVEVPPVLDNDPVANYAVGTLGMINGVLTAAGLPRVAIKFSDKDPKTGVSKILGFCQYEDPNAKVDPGKPMTGEEFAEFEDKIASMHGGA